MNTGENRWVADSDRPSRISRYDKRDLLELLEEHGGRARINRLTRRCRHTEPRVRETLKQLCSEGEVEVDQVTRGRVVAVRLAD